MVSPEARKTVESVARASERSRSAAQYYLIGGHEDDELALENLLKWLKPAAQTLEAAGPILRKELKAHKKRGHQKG